MWRRPRASKKNFPYNLQELRDRPDKVCCTEAKDKVKLNQDYLKGIRCKLKLWTIGQLLLLYKYVCINLASLPLQSIFTTVTSIQLKMLLDLKEKEMEGIGKLNDRIQYERRKKLKDLAQLWLFSS